MRACLKQQVALHLHCGKPSHDVGPQCSIKTQLTGNKTHSVTSCQAQYKNKGVSKYNEANKMDVCHAQRHGQMHICHIYSATSFSSNGDKEKEKKMIIPFTEHLHSVFLYFFTEVRIISLQI